MMRQKKIFRWLATAVISSLLLAAGCATVTKEAAKPTVEVEKQVPKAPAPEQITLALRFTEQDSATYRVTTQTERSVKFEGALPDEDVFKGGTTGNKVEITFTQRIDDIDDKGNAAAKITIEALKYLAKVKDNVVLDFDSSTEADQNSPLGKLIGQSYGVKLSPAGRVLEVSDVSDAQTVVRGGSSAAKAALKLVSTDEIKRRHTLTALPGTDKNQLCTGDNWSSAQSFSFGLMGSKAYERIYTLKEVKDTDSRRIAVVEMDAIPTSEMAEQLHEEQQTSGFSQFSDSTETYTGRLKLDLTAGKVEEALEKLQSEWLVVDPSARQQDNKEPAAVRMTATRMYRIEKID
jgi:hypothetical protein